MARHHHSGVQSTAMPRRRPRVSWTSSCCAVLARQMHWSVHLVAKTLGGSDLRRASSVILSARQEHANRNARAGHCGCHRHDSRVLVGAVTRSGAPTDAESRAIPAVRTATIPGAAMRCRCRHTRLRRLDCGATETRSLDIGVRASGGSLRTQRVLLGFGRASSGMKRWLLLRCLSIVAASG